MTIQNEVPKHYKLKVLIKYMIENAEPMTQKELIVVSGWNKKTLQRALYYGDKYNIIKVIPDLSDMRRRSYYPI